MKRIQLFLLVLLLIGTGCSPQLRNAISSSKTYLSNIQTELKKEWPKNRTINLVFHGHSVPAGYFKTPVVNTFEAYPFQLLKRLKVFYPTATINVINTSIGGENSVSGAKRFVKEVLVHQPDVLFIDYALNDRRVGLAAAHKAWSNMIEKAMKKDIPVILLTPSPDLKVNLLQTNNVLEQHTKQITSLSKNYGVGLVDTYALFKAKAAVDEDLSIYMSQGNHPNELGHSLIAEGLVKYFK